VKQNIISHTLRVGLSVPKYIMSRTLQVGQEILLSHIAGGPICEERDDFLHVAGGLILLTSADGQSMKINSMSCSLHMGRSICTQKYYYSFQIVSWPMGTDTQYFSQIADEPI
jgi:hypothetical protein